MQLLMMSAIIVIKNSTIAGIHKTKVSSHEDIALNVVADDSISHIDPDCMQVVFPLRDEVPAALLEEITYPKNPAHK